MNWLTQEMVDELCLASGYEEAIAWLAEQYFRENDATDSEAQHLADTIYGALHVVERDIAFIPFEEAIERAFNRLRINGYRCEQDWQCCMTCGWDAIPWEDADHAVWYHSQDRDSAMRNGELLLVWTGDAALIREALEAEGLQVEHDGTTQQRIRVRMAEQEAQA